MKSGTERGKRLTLVLISLVVLLTAVPGVASAFNVYDIPAHYLYGGVQNRKYFVDSSASAYDAYCDVGIGRWIGAATNPDVTMLGGSMRLTRQ